MHNSNYEKDILNIMYQEMSLTYKNLECILNNKDFYHRFTIGSSIYLDGFINKLIDYEPVPFDYSIRAEKRYSNKKKSVRRQGVYALYQKDKLIYIGMSTNLFQRLRSHEIKFDYADVYLTNQHPFDIEREAIIKYNPSLNSITYKSY